MSYSEKFSSSEHRAHLQLVATKIERGMRELRSLSDSSPTAKRRWGWELLQNAKDARHDEGVRAEVNYDGDGSRLIFQHSGKPFTADNIRFLIEQISTKDRTKDEFGTRKETGRFGTGFLSTHLLSEVVVVSGIAKEPELGYKTFTFTLDRSGQDLDTIISAAGESKDAVRNLDSLPDLANYDATSLNTQFVFNLVDPLSHKVASEGLEDLERCLAYALIYVPEIQSVTLLPKNLKYVRTYDGPLDGTSIRLSQVTVTLGTKQSGLSTFATVCRGFTKVSVPIRYHSPTQITIEQIPDNVPRLSCDFPLVGSEVFYIPFVINNPHFDPTDSRDGVYLNDTQRSVQVTKNNQDIIRESIACFGDLVRQALANNWGNLHLLANIRPILRTVDWVSHDWYRKHVADPVRALIAKEAIVTVATGDARKPMLNADSSQGVWFPTARKASIRKQIWDLARQWFPYSIPAEEHVELWSNLIWDDCGKLTVEQLCKFVESQSSKQSLESALKQTSCESWLNEFYNLLAADDENATLLSKYAIFPSQNGTFCKLSSLSRDVGNIEEELKEILALFSSDIRGQLGDGKLQIPIPIERSIDRSTVVSQINALALSKSNNRESAIEFRSALSALLAWIRLNPAKAQESFSYLSNHKYLLYDEDTVERNMDKAEQLDRLLAKSGVSNVAELQSLIMKQAEHAKRLPVSEQILASLGITSIEEWQQALRDRDLAAVFSHESTPTADMFAYVQSLIETAKANVIRHLSSLPAYDLMDCEEMAPTVLGGITKLGKEVQIVVRPAYGGEVIIYYSAERDVLDFLGDSELWVDTGTSQFQVTLGYLLKKTQIHKFPI